MTGRDAMSDAELETAVRRWLQNERLEPPPAALTERLLAIPTDDRPRAAWLRRPMLAVAATIVLAIVVSVGVLAVLDREPFVASGPAPECEGDPEALLEAARAQLAGVDGYRWSEEEQRWGLDPNFPISVTDTRYAWSGHRAEGAYRAPDLMRVVATFIDSPGPGGPYGVPEVIHIGGTTWLQTAQYDPQTGERESYYWQELGPGVGPRANHLAGVLPLTSEFGETTFERDGSELSWELPGSGGCLLIGSLRFPVPSGSVEIPGGRGMTVGIRLDAEGRVIAGAIESVNEDQPSDQRSEDYRYRFAVTYEVPDQSEFSPPDGPIHTPPPESAP